MSLAIIFPHPLTGSLGSIRRVEEIAASLCSRLKIQINVYTPYERKRRVLSGMASITPIPNHVAALGLSDIAYRLSKYVYYNRVLSRKLLIRSFDLSKQMLSKKTFEILRRDQAEAIQAEQDVSLPMAVGLGQELGIPVVADLHNISAEELVSAGVLATNDRAYVELQHHIGECLLNVDLVCVVSEAMKEYVSNHYAVSSRKILVVPPAGRPRSQSLIPKNQGRNVAFTGTVSYREHVDLFVKCLPFVQERMTEAKFYATRRGEDLNKMMRLCRELQLNMKWVWFTDEKDLFSFLSTCAVGVLPSCNDFARAMGTPVKLFDYMSVGLPVVANRIGGWSELIEQENIGIVTRDDPKDFAQGILRLLEDEELRAEFSRNALEAVEGKYNWDTAVEPLARFYESFC